MTGMQDPRIPLTLLTGFLGSGKTTLLNRLLQDPALADTAVIINEFGEIGLDHLLVDHVSENLLLLKSGCLCCTVRGDLVETLAQLSVRRERGEIAFRRVIVETTGLADPAPVLHTLMVEPSITPVFRLAAVVTTVDAVNGAATLARHGEAVKQVAMADVLLLTKTDLAPAGTVRALTAHLQRLNPGANSFFAVDGEVPAAVVLADGCVDPREIGPHRADEPQEGRHHGHDHLHHHDRNRHDEHIRAHCFSFDAPVGEVAFAHWIELLAALRGEQLLRVKGLVLTAEHPDQPLVVQGVQHVFHPPRRLAAWPSAERRTRLVFITHDLERELIARTFHKFAGAGPVPMPTQAA
jgi:G3E family GTPase